MTDLASAEHPCFSAGAAHRFSRLHLPVAPKCNIRCAYCNRKYDCVNESRPGVTSAVLTPEEALERFRRMKAAFPNLRVVGIAGPGDALANPEETFGTLGLIRKEDRDIEFCLSTNGVGIPRHLSGMLEAGLRYVTVTINSRRAETARMLYSWADDGEIRHSGIDAALFVLARQEEALDALRGTGIHVKVNIVYIPGVNDAEAGGIVRFAREKGAEIANIMPFIPTPGTFFGNFPMVSREALSIVREKMSGILPQMRHCAQCRADAVGNVLDERPLFVENGTVRELPHRAVASGGERDSRGESLRFAVASRSGFLVDLHFGHADEFLIYDAEGSAIRFMERRKVDKYCASRFACDDPGERMERVLASLSGCHAVLSVRIGDEPRRVLASYGIHAAMTCNRIEDAVRENYETLLRRRSEGAVV
ncbi:MAG: radical SAM protein [Deltaproteobacteria bacterium]|nr:radical SAM protein [Deltaproteobacteria bacterium]